MMVATSLPRQSLSCAISYGFLGGPGHSRKLRRLLKGHGYQTAENDTRADILIAHSAGCYLIPPDISPKVAVFVGMPLPQGSVRRTFLRANRQNSWSFVKKFHLLQGSYIAVCSLYYGLSQPRRNSAIVRQIPHAEAGAK